MIATGYHRDVFTPFVCLFVCVLVCLSRFVSGPFNYERFGLISNANILGNNANPVIIFPGYTQLRYMIRNKTSQERRSKVKITGSPSVLDTKPGAAPSLVEVSG